MANEKVKVKGKGNIPNYDTDLEIELDDKYEPYSKTVPDKTPFDKGFITWFNAFGVRSKQTKKELVKEDNVRYKVTLQKLPEGKRLFYLYNDQPVELFPDPDGNDKVHFFLDLGDPPTGMYP